MNKNTFKIYNTTIQKNTQIMKYLQDKYEVDDESVNLFLLFLGKSLKEKSLLYKKRDLQLENLNESSYESEYSSDDDENSLKRAVYYNTPDIEFEHEMRNDYEIFKNELRNDGQNYLYYNIFIDDFYRLFARFYNPVF